MAIPLSRFKNFIANAVVAAFNAKVDLMNTSPVPIKTGKFKLLLSGNLVDDMDGNLGWNEIERVSLNINPGATVVTVVNDPSSVTVTETIPEFTRTTDSGSDTEVSKDKGDKVSSDSSAQSSQDLGTETSNDEQTQVTQQEFGRGTRTTNDYTE